MDQEQQAGLEGDENGSKWQGVAFGGEREHLD